MSSDSNNSNNSSSEMFWTGDDIREFTITPELDETTVSMQVDGARSHVVLPLGATLVVSMPSGALKSQLAIDNIKAQFEDAFPANQVILVTAPVQFQVIRR